VDTEILKSVGRTVVKEGRCPKLRRINTVDRSYHDSDSRFEVESENEYPHDYSCKLSCREVPENCWIILNNLWKENF